MNTNEISTLRGDALEALMRPIFASDTVLKETVMFLEKGNEKELLFPIVSVKEITSYGGEITYTEGKDYLVREGKLYVTPDSSIPCITEAVYYGAKESILQTEYRGEQVLTYWGEGRVMTDQQICVTYTHAQTAMPDVCRCEASRFGQLLGKLTRGEDVTFLFCGDSITYGASSSYVYDYPPYQPTYPMLFTKAIADLFGYRIHYIDPALLSNGSSTPPVPGEDTVCGDRGRITFINTAIGGWGSIHGVENMQAHLLDQAKAYGCDLLVLAFGMNDVGSAPEQTVANLRTMADGVLALCPDSAMLLVSTMMPNPKATNGWYGNQQYQEEALGTLTEEYNASGKPCALVPVGSVSKLVLKRKDFFDYSGNNINHPNDFFARIYAQTLLQTLIGYEHLR